MTEKKAFALLSSAIIFGMATALWAGCSGGQGQRTQAQGNTQTPAATSKKVQPAQSESLRTLPAQTGQASAKTQAASSPKENGKLKVTFIELGSVRCIPCKMMKPIMDEIEKDYSGQVKVIFYDVWTEEGHPAAEKYGIEAIPSQIFLDSEGKEYYRHAGFFPKDELVKVLEQKGVK